MPKTWILIKHSKHDDEAWWWQDNGPKDNQIYNGSGGRNFKTNKMVILDRVPGNIAYEDLDHTKTGLVPKFEHTNSGWMDLEGKLHPCLYYHHDRYAELILKKTVSELEDAGWVRLTCAIKGEYLQYQELTQKQEDALQMLRIDLEKKHDPKPMVKPYKKGVRIVDGD